MFGTLGSTKLFFSSQSLLVYWPCPLFVCSTDASSRNLEVARNERGGYGVKAIQDLGQMEKAQPLSQHPLAIDAVS